MKQAVVEALATIHGIPKRSTDPLEEAQGCHGQVDVLDSLVRTMLSQNTTDKTSIRAFKSLKAQFPTWAAVLAAPDKDVEDAIRVGGLAAIKTRRIKEVLERLKEEREGEISLEWLKQESTETVKEWLSQLSGVGPKTVSCVLLFCLNRPDFPVDTHVWNISRHLGWCPPNASREDCYHHMNKLVPDDVKFELHVLLVEHGKLCGACRKGGRINKIIECPLVKMKRQGMFGGKSAVLQRQIEQQQSMTPAVIKNEEILTRPGKRTRRSDALSIAINEEEYHDSQFLPAERIKSETNAIHVKAERMH